MTSIRLRLASLLALALTAPLAPLGCVAGIESAESDELDELDDSDDSEEVASAGQALSVSDLAYQVVNLRNQWGCPSHSRCDQHLSWAPNGAAFLYAKDNTQDLVPWRLIPVPGTTDEFYIRNEWHCPADGSCDAHLSWTGEDALLLPKENTYDLVPWKFIPVPGTTDQFYIRNRWNCPADSRCNKHLSWAGGQIKLFPADNTADLVPWRVVTSQPSGRFSTFFRNSSGGKPPISYQRGVGTAPTTCPAGEELQDGLCYTSCASGYTGVGPVCWGSCPAGYADNGATCHRVASIISANTSSCPWYDACGLTLAPGCSSCPSGYVNDGCTCRRDASTVAKPSYGRGVGEAPSICPGNKVMEAGLCYSSCDPGYEGVGSDCWVDSFEGLCTGLYDATLAKAAVQDGSALTFGIGAGIASGGSLGFETGVAYGETGEFGCYVQTCAGVVTNVGISAWTTFGVMNEFSQVAGGSTVTFVGTSLGIVGASVGVVSSGEEVQGVQDSLSLGVGLSPIDLGTQSCNATVTRIW
jgi:hypothetical protein